MSNPEFFPGETLPASKLQDVAEYGTWTPTLTVTVLGTNPTLGTGSVLAGSYHRNGRLITLGVNITFGTSGVVAGSGTYQIGGLPFAIDVLAAGMSAGGQLFMRDDSVNERHVVSPRVQSSTAFTLVLDRVNPATEVTNSSPFTWAANDSIRGTITYIGTP